MTARLGSFPDSLVHFFRECFGCKRTGNRAERRWVNLYIDVCHIHHRHISGIISLCCMFLLVLLVLLLFLFFFFLFLFFLHRRLGSDGLLLLHFL